MREHPSQTDLLQGVIDFLQSEAMPQLTGQTAFHARVAANVLGIVQRELKQSPSADADEARRLAHLLGRSGSLEALNADLCARIAADTITLDTSGLAEHLWATTLAKVAVDQPGYESYRHALAMQPKSKGS